MNEDTVTCCLMFGSEEWLEGGRGADACHAKISRGVAVSASFRKGDRPALVNDGENAYVTEVVGSEGSGLLICWN